MWAIIHITTVARYSVRGWEEGAYESLQVKDHKSHITEKRHKKRYWFHNGTLKIVEPRAMHSKLLKTTIDNPN